MNDEASDRRSALDEFAATVSPKKEMMPAIIKAAPPVLIHGAQMIVKPRNMAEVLLTLNTLAAAAGEDWYYRFPVKNKKTGQTEYIDGPSIKLANDVAHYYGNCEIDPWTSNEGIDFWEFSARFVDLETGFSMTRQFRQSKGAARIGGGDAGRNMEIAFAIGQSKAIRNVIVNSLQSICDHACKQAHNAIVDRIGRDIDNWRTKIVERISALVPLPRVEAVIGRPVRDWLATDIARVYAMGAGISDGMATVDETFPPLKSETASTEKALDTLADQSPQDKTGETAKGKPETDLNNSVVDKKAVASEKDTPIDSNQPTDMSVGQAAAPAQEPPAYATGTAAALRQEAIVKLLDLASNEALSMQERLENLENVLPAWEDKLDPEFMKQLADLCVQVADGRIRRSTADKKLEGMK